MSLTNGLIDLINTKPVTDDDLEAAANAVTDTISCALGGVDTTPGKMLLEWSREAGDDPGRRAFLHGGLAHILEIDDLHRDSVTHPGCVVIPAAWAVAEKTGADNRTFLTAVLHGYEACCRIGMSVGKEHYKVWHNTATCGPFGAAMAVAHILQLSKLQSVWALGNAGTQSAGLWQFLSEGVMSKHLHTGRAAESGVLAAQLAAKNFTGAAHILEGEQGFYKGACPNAIPELLLHEPNAPWQLRRTSMKPWPCCRHTHPTIDAALELSRKIDAAAIAKINISTYEAAVDVCNRPAPESDYQAKFSLQHTVACALTDGAVDFNSFNATARDKHQALRECVAITIGEPYKSDYPQKWGAELIVQLHSGETLTAQRHIAKGDPELPLTSDEVSQKAEMVIAQSGKPPSYCRDMAARLLSLSSTKRLPHLSF